MEVCQGSSVDPIMDNLSSRVSKMNEKMLNEFNEDSNMNDCQNNNGFDSKAQGGPSNKIATRICNEPCEGKPQFKGKFTDPSSIVPPKDLDELISRLHEVFAGEDICVDYVQKLMTSYKSNPREWKQFAKFDKYKYTRNLVNEGNGKFNLMILCWNEAQGSSIHSHSDSHCFLKVLDGDLKEELFEWPAASLTGDDSKKDFIGHHEDEEEELNEGEMRKKGEAKISKNECAYINDSIGLHRVENESHFNKAVTLHLYSPPFQQCQCFDQRSGRATTGTMTFWSKYGKRTPFGKYPEKCQQPVENN